MERNQRSKKITNMKNFLAYMAMFISITACSQTQQLTQAINQQPNEGTTENMFLDSLQKTEDLVIAFSKQNTAWGKSAAYYVLSAKQNKWSGFYFTQPLHNKAMPSAQKINVNQTEANALAQLLLSEKIYLIKGEEAACLQKCKIDDAENWLFILLTPSNSHTIQFTAPYYFEDCCPGNANRTHFIEAAEQLQRLIVMP
jgi:hypothetical protein